MKHEYAIHGMHCQSCINRVGAALRGIPGVTAAEVTLAPPRARVEMSHHVPTVELARAVRTAGDYQLSDGDHADAAGTLPILSGSATPAATAEKPKESLYPLFLIVGYIAGSVAVIAWANQTTDAAVMMRHFMAGFFLVFSFFKLLDLRGFADAYCSYDIVARAVPAWALAYPFFELALGVAYLIDFQPTITSATTLVFMLVGAVGVLKALLDRRAIRCACLGTALNLPMTKVTLVEDAGMAAMTAAMLAMAYT